MMNIPAPDIDLLDTGYFHARWNRHQWLQWPIGREATIDDGFGWLSPQHVRAANEAMDALLQAREQSNA